MEDKEILKIWTAGIFDGEGSALIEKTGKPSSKSYQIVVAVATTSPDISDHIKAEWGGHYRADRDMCHVFRLNTRIKPKHEVDYSLYFTRSEAKKFLIDILPYLKHWTEEVIIVLRALYAIPDEKELALVGRKKVSGVVGVLEPFYLELRKTRSDAIAREALPLLK